MEQPKILSEYEVQTLIMSLMGARGDNGATEAEAAVLVDWAEKVRFEQATLDLILEGRVVADVEEGRITLIPVEQPEQPKVTEESIA